MMDLVTEARSNANYDGVQDIEAAENAKSKQTVGHIDKITPEQYPTLIQALKNIKMIDKVVENKYKMSANFVVNTPTTDQSKKKIEREVESKLKKTLDFKFHLWMD